MASLACPFLAEEEGSEYWSAPQRLRSSVLPTFEVSVLNFEFTKTKHLICKTTFKYYNMLSLDIWYLNVCLYRYVEINLVQGKKFKAKKIWRSLSLRNHVFKGKETFNVHLLFQIQSDWPCRIFTLFIYIRFAE